MLTLALQVQGALAADDRTISFFHIHTKETLTVLYKKDGRFLPDAMKKINWILRDWRKDQATEMDPNTIDIIWEMHRELGSAQPVHIISGYRSRDTNEMLRKTRGGQASQSQHITGKAVDISFPDVPVRRLRYSAMIRERGGVGYYPTSGIPFVHVDTARVRHWPRMPRDELALLFPSGRSKHAPADGRPITPADVKAARTRRRDLAQEVAQFYALRDGPKAPIQVAEAAPPPVITAPLPVPPQPMPAVRPPAPHERMAVGAPQPPPAATQPDAMASLVARTADTKPAEPRVAAVVESLPQPKLVAAPQLVAAPKPVDRPSQLVARLPDADRSRLDMLVKLASFEEPAAPTPATAQPSPPPVTAPAPLKAAAMTPGWPFPTGAITEQAAPPPQPEEAAPHPLAEGASDWRSGWAAAPAYDEDHPDELAYRPFALAPLLTETASFDDPALQTLVHPDAGEALAMLDDEGTALPMRFGTGHLETAMAWAQAFRGEAVDLAGLAAPAAQPADAAGPRLLARAVKTLPR